MNKIQKNYSTKSWPVGDADEYDNKFNSYYRFDTIKQDFAECQIYRNNQMIYVIPINLFKHSSARGDVKSLLKICYLHTCISYYTHANPNIIKMNCVIIQTIKIS